jgi:pilus assembly protein Flp/PilA
MDTPRALLRRCARLLRNEDGAVAIEYALIAVIITVAIVAALTSIGNHLGNIFSDVGNNLQAP